MITERKFLFEAEDDNTNATNDTAENNDTSAETNDNASEENNNENKEDNNTEEENNEENKSEEEDKPEENKEDENKEEDNQDENDTTDDDFSIGDDDNDNSDESSDNDSSTEEESKKSDNEIKAKERELFDTLSIAEQQIKVKELKKNFADLYNECTTLIDRYNEISIEFDGEINYINRIISCLIDLKGMLSFYILNIFDLKSYFENDIIFNRYLTIFDSIRNLTKTIKDDTFKEEK